MKEKSSGKGAESSAPASYEPNYTAAPAPTDAGATNVTVEVTVQQQPPTAATWADITGDGLADTILPAPAACLQIPMSEAGVAERV